MTVALPGSWETFDPTLLESNPQQLSNMIAALESARFPWAAGTFVVQSVTIGAAGTVPHIFAADITANAARHHASTTLIVTSRPRLDDASCDADALDGASQLPGSTVTSADVHFVTLGGHQAAEVEADWHVTSPSPGTPAVMEVVLYSLIESAPAGDSHWLLAFITTPDQVAGYLPTLRQIVATFAVNQ